MMCHVCGDLHSLLCNSFFWEDVPELLVLSQFYILYKSAHHLDFKHTVFGRVVGGELLLLPSAHRPKKYSCKLYF